MRWDPYCGGVYYSRSYFLLNPPRSVGRELPSLWIKTLDCLHKTLIAKTVKVRKFYPQARETLRYRDYETKV
jgi:hypothetical protein